MHGEFPISGVIPAFRRSFLGLLVLGLGLGCSTVPEGKVPRDAVFRAASEVLTERYPQSWSTLKDDVLVAVTPMEVEGATKVRKQISIMIGRNYTGNYEPIVRVRKSFDLGSPHYRPNPETDNLALAAPVAAPEWRHYDDMLLEEKDLYDAILQKLQPRDI
ncbi:MAG TPA: hypothetical protein VMT52_02930 [Planctomycetota bacterium]|nr:hypothetical protein [Planctomycetota bacterium]